MRGHERARHDARHRRQGQHVRSGGGRDVLYGRRGPDRIGESNDDTDRDRVYGGPGDDFIVGHEAPEWIFGGRGDDEIEDRGAPGVLRYGPGRDTVRYAPGVQKVADDCEVRIGEPTRPS